MEEAWMKRKHREKTRASVKEAQGMDGSMGEGIVVNDRKHG
jgi:hypothetical protein